MKRTTGIMTLSGLLARARREERGYALVAVLGVGMLMMALVAGALSVSTSAMVKTNTDDDYNSAYAAAVAGLNDYKARLTSAPTYVKYGNPNANFSKTSKAADGTMLLSLPTGKLDNPAFDVDATGRWADVPGNTNKSQFRYEINTKDYASSGIIHVRATGRVGNAVRSVIADLRKKGFFDFVYFTQYEVQDSRVSSSAKSCERYPWDKPVADRSDSCVVTFAKADTIDGDVFSNDQFTACEATFTGNVTSAAPSSYAAVVTRDGCNDPIYKQANNTSTGGSNPANGASIQLPPSAAPLAAEGTADSYTGDSAGCTYTGPTSITFNADGTMTVISPWSQVTRPNADGSAGSNPTPAECGAVATSKNSQSGTLQSIGGATVTVPKDNVIWVQDVPTDSSDANYPSYTSNGTSDPTKKPSFTRAGATFSCTAGTYSNNYTTAYGWSLTQSSTSVQFPRSDENYSPSGLGSSAYKCNAGDVYIKGKVKGHVTVGASRFAYITDDVTYAQNSYITGSDYNLIGIVGQSAVIVYNPMSYSTWYGTQPLLPKNREINGALLAVDGTIMVQNYNVGGARGQLTVKGSLAQKFRGTVATGTNPISTGFSKFYQYDKTLKYNAPPKYLAPANLSYGVSQVASVPSAFTATGAKAPNS